uniref:Uncharacterized protein n=1 Tax=viral metagenome TaxID=1070528 RepID=A0A6C0KV02_9ZZZZ
MSGRGRGKRAAIKPENEVVEEKPKKTSKKKQFPIVAVITPDGIEGNLLPEAKRPLIVHLPIQSKDVYMNDMPIMYDPHPPTEAQPYDSHADNPFCDEVEYVPSTAVIETVSVPVIEKPATPEKVIDAEVDYYSMKSTLLVQFKESSEVKQIPMKSDTACFWCCHTFTYRPVVLPIRDTGEYLTVTGNFCSPECATSYLFDMRQDSHTRWEQMALLYRVYGEACQGKIHPAPPRTTLKLFGGMLSIQEYRNLIQSHKVRVDVHLPPMVSILATMDTKPIDFYDASLTKNVNETVKERLQKAEEVLRLRRTKPLKAWESTLDACLNLKIRSDRPIEIQ